MKEMIQVMLLMYVHVVFGIQFILVDYQQKKKNVQIVIKLLEELTIDYMSVMDILEFI